MFKMAKQALGRTVQADSFSTFLVTMWSLLRTEPVAETKFRSKLSSRCLIVPILEIPGKPLDRMVDAPTSRTAPLTRHWRSLHKKTSADMLIERAPIGPTRRWNILSDFEWRKMARCCIYTLKARLVAFFAISRHEKNDFWNLARVWQVFRARDQFQPPMDRCVPPQKPLLVERVIVCHLTSPPVLPGCTGLLQLSLVRYI